MTIDGDASTATSAGERTFKASATIRHDEPSSARPWRVYSGATGGTVVGDATAYPRLSTNKDGEASSTTWIPVALATTAVYHVNLHLSDRELRRVMACGDLALQ